ncbi:UNVERIFIED_CONTAM: hypothetical protein FKN15_025644 [Acipenser sinensis]
MVAKKKKKKKNIQSEEGEPKLDPGLVFVGSGEKTQSPGVIVVESGGDPQPMPDEDLTPSPEAVPPCPEEEGTSTELPQSDYETGSKTGGGTEAEAVAVESGEAAEKDGADGEEDDIMHLETCEEPVWNIQATIELQTNHIGKGCDRDSYSDRSVRRLCGAVRGEVDLLPPSSLSTNWTAGLTTVPSPDSSLVFVFNGSMRQACEVPQSALRELGVSAGDHFTLQLWMKHASGTLPAQQQHGRAKREEESIICNTVCDDDWHHYAVNLEFPTVTLYVDGVTYDPALIHDNGPLRPPAPHPRLVIGASWTEEAEKGSTNSSESEQDPAPPRFHSHFRGLLAGFTVRPGRVEPHNVIECLYACREGLDFGDLESLGSGMKVHVNPTQSMLILEGDDIENFNRAIQQVTYRNSLRCFSEEGCVSIRDVEGYLVVLQPDAPQIFLSGTAHFARPASEFETPQGVPLFSELRITCSLSHSINTASQGMEGGASQGMEGGGEKLCPTAAILDLIPYTRRCLRHEPDWQQFHYF